MAEAFADRVRRYREAEGLTQQELADKAGVHRNAISRWETGYSRPTVPWLLKLSEALGVEPSAFLDSLKESDP